MVGNRVEENEVRVEQVALVSSDFDVTILQVDAIFDELIYDSFDSRMSRRASLKEGAKFKEMLVGQEEEEEKVRRSTFPSSRSSKLQYKTRVVFN